MYQVTGMFWEVSEEDQAEGVMFQALDPESEDGVNLAVTATEVGTEYDLDSMAQELDEAGYIDVEKVSSTESFCSVLETESLLMESDSWMTQESCTTFRSDRRARSFSRPQRLCSSP